MTASHSYLIVALFPPGQVLIDSMQKTKIRLGHISKLIPDPGSFGERKTTCRHLVEELVEEVDPEWRDVPANELRQTETKGGIFHGDSRTAPTSKVFLITTLHQ